jgi:hypothetical protein
MMTIVIVMMRKTATMVMMVAETVNEITSLEETYFLINKS